MTPFQKRIKTYFETQAPVCADHIICKKSGAVELKHSYFYHTQSSEQYAASVRDALAVVQIAATVTDRDDFAQWPKSSYIVAIIQEA